MSVMIEIICDAKAGITVLRFAGVQTTEEIADSIAAFIVLCKSQNEIRLLCDWRDVLGWACDTRSLPVHDWIAAAGRVERVALIHHHRWNWQAAWLAAMLRRRKVTVRSWHRRQSEAARKWLLASSADSGAA